MVLLLDGGFDAARIPFLSPECGLRPSASATPGLLG